MLIAIDFSGVSVMVAAVAFLVGVLTWWIGKLLSDKKEVVENQVKIEDLERRVSSIEGDVKTMFKER